MVCRQIASGDCGKCTSISVVVGFDQLGYGSQLGPHVGVTLLRVAAALVQGACRVGCGIHGLGLSSVRLSSNHL